MAAIKNDAALTLLLYLCFVDAWSHLFEELLKNVNEEDNICAYKNFWEKSKKNVTSGQYIRNAVAHGDYMISNDKGKNGYIIFNPKGSNKEIVGLETILKLCDSVLSFCCALYKYQQYSRSHF